MNGKCRHELTWLLLRSFFRSRTAFLRLFKRYERLVASFANELGTHRSRLKLPADELLTLLDFKSLEDLRDQEIFTLKETAHDLFRGPDATDRFDHFVSNIYHELSILKEEHYTLKEDYVRLDKREYNRFFGEVSEFYPKRLRHVKNLYAKAQRRLEELLPEMAGERILVRSLYLYGEELLSEDYPGGLVGFYRKMYPEGGDLEGIYQAGRSFKEAGFHEEALQAFRKAHAAGKRWSRRKRTDHHRKLVSQVDQDLAEMESVSARL